MKWLVLLLVLCGPSALSAQTCTVDPTDTTKGLGRVAVPQAGLTGSVYIANLHVNAYDCGARPGLSTVGNQTTALQAAITYACGRTAVGGAAHPIVEIPAGSYLFDSLTVTCSDLTIRGAGISATVLCSQAPSTATMLYLGTATTAVTQVTVEDLELSGFCGTPSYPNGINLWCNRCHINKVQVSGYTSWGIRFLGVAASGTGGFSIVNQCKIDNGEAAGSAAFVIVNQGGSTGGPDANEILHCYVNTDYGFIKDSSVTGNTSLRASQLFLGNKFVGNTSSVITAWTGQSQDDRVIENRFENTGTGGMTFTFDNGPFASPPATFIGNHLIPGVGPWTWSDTNTFRVVRIAENGHGQACCYGTVISQSAMGGGTNLTAQTGAIAATTLYATGSDAGANLYRATLSLILTTAGTGGTITGKVLCNNGVAATTQSAPALSASAAVGTEVDFSAPCYSAANQNIQFSTSVAGLTGSPKYAIRARVDFIGP
jgi:hypothetical protein